MTDFLKQNFEVYLIENKTDAEKNCGAGSYKQAKQRKREKARINVKKMLSGNSDVLSRVKKFVDCRTKDVARRELYIVEG